MKLRKTVYIAKRIAIGENPFNFDIYLHFVPTHVTLKNAYIATIATTDYKDNKPYMIHAPFVEGSMLGLIYKGEHAPHTSKHKVTSWVDGTHTFTIKEQGAGATQSISPSTISNDILFQLEFSREE